MMMTRVEMLISLERRYDDIEEFELLATYCHMSGP